MLWAIVAIKGVCARRSGTWLGAFTLFVYAFAFSYAYVHLETGAGALLLFGAVQCNSPCRDTGTTKAKGCKQ